MSAHNTAPGPASSHGPSAEGMQHINLMKGEMFDVVDDLPGMWEQADLIGGETDCDLTQNPCRRRWEHGTMTDWKALATRLAEALREVEPFASDYSRWGHIRDEKDNARIRAVLAEYDEAEQSDGPECAVCGSPLSNPVNIGRKVPDGRLVCQTCVHLGERLDGVTEAQDGN